MARRPAACDRRLLWVDWKMRSSIAFALIALTILGGCAVRDVVLEEPSTGYVADAAARVAAADWSAAEDVRVELSEYAFQPAAYEFRAGFPYRLEIANTGDTPHTFVSEGFFKAMAAERLTGGEAELFTPFIKTIAVLPGAVRTLSFVAMTPGTYRLECTVPGHALFGMVGEITIR